MVMYDAKPGSHHLLCLIYWLKKLKSWFSLSRQWSHWKRTTYISIQLQNTQRVCSLLFFNVMIYYFENCNHYLVSYFTEKYHRLSGQSLAKLSISWRQSLNSHWWWQEKLKFTSPLCPKQTWVSLDSWWEKLVKMVHYNGLRKK